MDKYLKILRENNIKLAVDENLMFLIGPRSMVPVEENIFDLGDNNLIMMLYPEVRKIRKDVVKRILREQTSVYIRR